MANLEIDSSTLPSMHRHGFEQFAQALLELAGDNLLGLSAFGGWLESDPFFEDTPARSVAVLKRVDLRMLDRLASSGAKFGKSNISAPLMMTPEYIKSSCDVFPLELMEIQQLHTPIVGDDRFVELTFGRNVVRLQCEREFKGELIQLRQGLLAAAGRHKLLPELCRACAARIVRMLRGVLFLGGVSPAPKLTHEIVKRAAETTGKSLDTLARIVAAPAEVEFDTFERFYGEIDALTSYVDGLTDA
ncbi:MAG: hypothetical protein KKI02_06695 [Planctomycetes bacterium]|nr:hypothetical protein [Planctomycetota bacterium]